jgi:hypothetical protein
MIVVLILKGDWTASQTAVSAHLVANPGMKLKPNPNPNTNPNTNPTLY